MALLGSFYGKRAPTGRRAALIVALLAAFLLQSFLTATHVHNPVAASGTVAFEQDASKQPAHRRAPADPAISCTLCHAVAQSGHYLAPDAALLVPPAAVAAWLFAPVFLASAMARPSHDWQSRAPPA